MKKGKENEKYEKDEDSKKLIRRYGKCGKNGKLYEIKMDELILERK